MAAPVEPAMRPGKPVGSDGSGGGFVEQQRSVLIVDPSEENRDILRTALERKGVRIHVAGGRDQGAVLARKHQPSLIVLDLEVAENASEGLCGSLGEPSAQGSPSIVVLGTCRRARQTLPSGEFVSKPYHYGPLIRRIEELLKTSGPESVPPV
jgi:DNA-binding response OmpR family regulator